MNDTTIDALAPMSPQSAVPQGYAEKAMASLMQLHTELMDEKERRVELYRRLMEREQSIAELKSYTRLLEEKLASLSPQKREEPAPQPIRATPPQVRPVQIARPAPVRLEQSEVSAAARTPSFNRTPPPLPLPRTPAPPPREAPPARQAVAVGAARGFRAVMDGWKTW